MKALLVLGVTVLTAVAQVSVAPLFTASAATFDFALSAIALLMVFGGPRMAMAAVPLAAIFLGFLSDRSPGLLLVAYLPLIPAAAVLADLDVPLNSYARLVAVALGTGLFARTLLAVAAAAHGAEFPLAVVTFDLLLPGALLDFTIITILYFPFRFVGWEPRSMALQRGRF